MIDNQIWLEMAGFSIDEIKGWLAEIFFEKRSSSARNIRTRRRNPKPGRPSGEILINLIRARERVRGLGPRQRCKKREISCVARAYQDHQVFLFQAAQKLPFNFSAFAATP